MPRGTDRKKKKDTVLWKKKVIENCQPGGGLRSPPSPQSNRVGKKGRHLHSCPPLTSGSCPHPPAACIVSRVNHTPRMCRCPQRPLYCYSDPRVQTELTSPVLPEQRAPPGHTHRPMTHRASHLPPVPLPGPEQERKQRKQRLRRAEISRPGPRGSHQGDWVKEGRKLTETSEENSAHTVLRAGGLSPACDAPTRAMPHPPFQAPTSRGAAGRPPPQTDRRPRCQSSVTQ